MTTQAHPSRTWLGACPKCKGAVHARYDEDPACLNCGAAYTEDDMTKIQEALQKSKPARGGPSTPPGRPTPPPAPAQPPPHANGAGAIPPPPQSRAERRAWYAAHRDAIIADLRAIGVSATARKYATPKSYMAYKRKKAGLPPNPRGHDHSLYAPAASPRARATTPTGAHPLLAPLQATLVILDALSPALRRQVLACLVVIYPPVTSPGQEN